jgi:translation elongation factor EF-Tu-like GTPase
VGFWDKLLGREGNDSTVTDFEAATESANAQAASSQHPAGIVATAADPSFRLVVEDVFTITGRGTVITGNVASGTIAVGNRVSIANAGVATISSTVTGIEMFRKQVTSAGAGENIGLLLEGVRRDDITRGAVITPGI